MACVSNLLNAPRRKTARSGSAGGAQSSRAREDGPLRARVHATKHAVAVTLILSLESGLAWKNRAQLLALKVINTFEVAARNVRFLDDVLASFQAGWSQSRLWWRRRLLGAHHHHPKVSALQTFQSLSIGGNDKEAEGQGEKRNNTGGLHGGILLC
jgi:hypothetical protein